MDITQVLVTAAGGGLLIFVAWFFFAPQRAESLPNTALAPHREEQ